MELFYEQGHTPVWERLISWRGSLRGAKRKQADRLLGYIAQRRDLIRYPAFHQHGWQIGSGPTNGVRQSLDATAQRPRLTLGSGQRRGRHALGCLDRSNAWHLYRSTLDPKGISSARMPGQTHQHRPS